MASGLGFSRTPSWTMRDAPPSSPAGAPSSAGWKMNFTVPGKPLPHPCQNLGHAHEDGHMVVMATGVHDPHLLAVVLRPDLRGEGKVHQLGDGEGIHVGPKGHHRPREAPPKEPHHAGVGHLGLNLHAQGPEVLGDDPGGPELPVPQLRVLAWRSRRQVTTLLGDGFDPGVDLGPEGVQVGLLGRGPIRRSEAQQEKGQRRREEPGPWPGTGDSSTGRWVGDPRLAGVYARAPWRKGEATNRDGRAAFP